MKFGIMTGSGFDPEPGLHGMVENARRIESLGFDSLWMSTIYNYDALTALTAISMGTDRIELGTAVVATHPRHPMAMAQQALTVSAASKGRFTLGIGLSHRYVIEQEMGLSYEKPVGHMTDYLKVLLPLLNEGHVNYQGEHFSTHATLAVPGAKNVSVLIAALGPKMLQLAGEQADGTTLWLTGPKTIADHTVPIIRRAAREAGRSAPRIVAGVPLVLTDQPEQAREMVSTQLAMYSDIPSYRAMLDRENANAPGDVALVGNEAQLRQQIRQLEEIGVTDLNAVLVSTDSETYERSLAFLANECSS
ncbi:MAG: LLM class F420-dependent oxidoreductase [Halioglobus sp.]